MATRPAEIEKENKPPLEDIGHYMSGSQRRLKSLQRRISVGEGSLKRLNLQAHPALGCEAGRREENTQTKRGNGVEYP
jgi:hypothetical protein